MEGLAKIVEQSAKTNNVLRIKYRDVKDQDSTRNVEPYEIKGGKLWAYCRKRKSIRQFDMNRIQSATTTKHKYSPKWPVKMGNEKTAHFGLAGLSKVAHEKQASLLGLAGLGAAIHVAPNVVMKAIKSTDTGQKALTGMFSAGVDMGRTGRKLHPNLQSAMEYGIGPESTVEYSLGRAMGSRISHMEPERQERFINKAKGITQSHLNRLFPDKMHDFEKVPVLGSVKHYFDGKGENKVKDFFMNKSVPNDYKVGLKNHAINAGMLAGVGAIEPHALIQPVLSGIRKQVAKSPLGGKIFSKGFENGNAGVPMSKAKETLIDMAVSPSVLDPYRMGKAMKEQLPGPANDAVKSRLDIGKMYKGMTQ